MLGPDATSLAGTGEEAQVGPGDEGAPPHARPSVSGPGAPGLRGLITSLLAFDARGPGRGHASAGLRRSQVAAALCCRGSRKLLCGLTGLNSCSPGRGEGLVCQVEGAALSTQNLRDVPLDHLHEVRDLLAQTLGRATEEAVTREGTPVSAPVGCQSELLTGLPSHTDGFAPPYLRVCAAPAELAATDGLTLTHQWLLGARAWGIVCAHASLLATRAG
jgi:hypothetical protein